MVAEPTCRPTLAACLHMLTRFLSTVTAWIQILAANTLSPVPCVSRWREPASESRLIFIRRTAVDEVS
jgi:hypothetical protein